MHIEPADLIDTRLRVATWNVWWRFGPWTERQPAIAETLRRIDADVIALQEVWGRFDLYTTHLNWRYDESHVRQAQVRALAEFVGESTGRAFPPIVCGDFNAEPDSDEVRMLTGRAAVPVPRLVLVDAWDVAGDGAGFTWSNDNAFAARDLEADRRIDYVYVGWRKARGAGHVVDARVAAIDPIDGVHPSDHYAVVAELRY